MMVPVVKGPRAVKGKTVMNGKAAVKRETAVKAVMVTMVAEVVAEMVTMVTRPGRGLGRHKRAGAQDKNGRTRKHQFAKHDALH
jgi:hypothetical protein